MNKTRRHNELAMIHAIRDYDSNLFISSKFSISARLPKPTLEGCVEQDTVSLVLINI